MPKSNGSLAKVVDDLGVIKAQIAKCKAIEDKLIKKLKDRGCRVYEGVLYEANVFEQSRTLIDWEGVVKELVSFVPPRVLEKHTNNLAIVVCKVTARKTR